jgi:subtilisin-like proprotein convertase family protein
MSGTGWFGRRRRVGRGRLEKGALKTAPAGFFVFSIFALAPVSPADVPEAVLLRPPDRDALAAVELLRQRSRAPVSARWDPATGRLAALEGRFTLPAGATPGEEIAARCLSFLDELRWVLGWSPEIELRLDSQREGIGTQHLRFAAYLDGVAVSGAEAAVHLELASRQGPAKEGGRPEFDIVYLTSRLFPELPPPEGERDDFLAPRLSSAEARLQAERAVGTRSLRSASRARLEILPLPAPGRLVYAGGVPSLAPRGQFLVRVDARSGEVVSVGDLLRYGGAEPREGRGRVFIANPVVTLRDSSLEDMADSAAAVPAEAYSDAVLLGLDGEGGLTGTYVTTAGTPEAVRRARLAFDFLRDHDGFEEVMAYYHIDSVQRFVQSLGFNNIYHRQIPVFVNSEPPGVPYTEAQAYYLPSFDGSGTGEIAFGSGGVDAAEDPEVIVHEYGHALQDNQVPGFGGTFENLETFALGEGWADFLSGAYHATFSGGVGDACLGEWWFRGVAELFGKTGDCVRRLDSTKVYPQDLVGEPHADGEIWSAALWEAYQALGREQVLRLVLQSHFFLRVSSGFEDAALAVLRADTQLHAGEHEEVLRRIFDNRGILREAPVLAWFHVVRHAPAITLPSSGAAESKLRLRRAGVIASGPNAVEVYVHIAHEFPGELQLSLRAPSGASVVLNSAGSRPLPSGPIVFGERPEPSDSFESLAGEPIAGVWTLRLENGDLPPGMLSEWGLRFRGFVRGDTDASGAITVNDAVLLIRYLFARGSLACPKAGDIDDDGRLDVSDAVGVLRFVFGRAGAPPEPFPAPGEDLTPDALTCE